MKVGSLTLVVLLSFGLSGCYLAHVTTGQAQLLWARQPIVDALDDPTLPNTVRAALEQVLAVRSFAESLGLDVEGSYRHYVPWPGDQIVTTVVATRPREVEPAGFWFPIVGRVPYKGYFDRKLAQEQAVALRDQGLDVCEVSVRAYSTLGWFDDPVTGPMLRQPEGDLVETLLHELVHATAFVSSQPEFNEGVASFIGEEARVRFFDQRDGVASAQTQRARVALRRQVRGEMLALRDGVASLYATEGDPETGNAERDQLVESARGRIAALPFENDRGDEFAQQLRLNNACLALTATYGNDQECYESVLAKNRGDLPEFIHALRAAAKQEDPRAALLGDCATFEEIATAGSAVSDEASP